jgi:glycosyltransferase involved in cell wall biosynthesis
MPKVSVIIPLFQTERFIAEAIRSVQAQTYEDFEILVINDGSFDAGPAIARAINDPRLHVLDQENRGLAGARNSGIRNATGEYLAFLDADDLWRPKKLERHVAQLESDATIGVSFCASALMDDDGRLLGLQQRPRNSNFDVDHIFCRNPVGNGSAPVIRREVFDSVAYFDDKLQRACWFDESFRQSEDIECWTRIAVAGGWRFAFVDEALTLYRVSRLGLSADIEKQIATWRRFRSKVAQYAPELNARVGDLAEAYQLRYLARRSIQSSRGDVALKLIMHALKMHPRILVEEPSRTLTTLAAAFASVALPQPLYARLTRTAVRLAGSTIQARM